MQWYSLFAWKHFHMICIFNLESLGFQHWRQQPSFLSATTMPQSETAERLLCRVIGFHITFYTSYEKKIIIPEVLGKLTSTLQSRSLKPHLWLLEQHRALRTPSHSELRVEQLAVSSAHIIDRSSNLIKITFRSSANIFNPHNIEQWKMETIKMHAYEPHIRRKRLFISNFELS